MLLSPQEHLEVVANFTMWEVQVFFFFFWGGGLFFVITFGEIPLHFL